MRSADGSRELIDELVDCISLSTLRKVVTRAAEILGLAKEDHPPAKKDDDPAKVENTARIDTSAIPRAVPLTPPTNVTPPPPAPDPGPARARARSGKQPPSVPASRAQTDTTPIHPRSRTQPVPTPDAEGGAFADEEVVGPDTVVMIDEISS